MTGLIILAAGRSNRLGSPKQNLQFEGRTLLERAVELGRGRACNKIIVVPGANSNELVPIPGTTLYNKYWAQGMASSIRTGMLKINNNTNIDKVIIMLFDQPFVDSIFLDRLINKQAETGKSIIASSCKSTTGVPVLFDQSLFTELLSLQGTAGAKEILRNNAGNIATVPL